MDNTIKQLYGKPGLEIVTRRSIWSRFMDWCVGQEENRLGWLALAIVGHGCVLTPITLFAIVLSGNAFPLIMLATIAMVSCLIVNLAAMPTKVTIPTFFISIIVDLSIIGYSLVLGFDIQPTYV